MNKSEWGNLFNQDCTEGTFTIFSNEIECALKNSHQWKHSSFEKIKVRSPFKKTGWQRKLANYINKSTPEWIRKLWKIKSPEWPMTLLKKTVQIFWMAKLHLSVFAGKTRIKGTSLEKPEITNEWIQDKLLETFVRRQYHWPKTKSRSPDLSSEKTKWIFQLNQALHWSIIWWSIVKEEKFRLSVYKPPSRP